MTNPTNGAHNPPSNLLQNPTTSAVTRYLCAAGYLDTRVRDAGVRELLWSHRRAVAPSYGLDLVPVLRHFLKARALQLRHDLTVCVALVVCLVFTPRFTMLWWMVSLGVYTVWWVMTLRLASSRRQKAKNALLWVIALVGLGGLFVLMVARAIMNALAPGLGPSAESSWTPQSNDLSLLEVVVPTLALVVVAASAFSYRRARHLILTEDLSEQHFNGQVRGEVDTHTQSRLDQIEVAQSGNVTLYSSLVSEQLGTECFVGSGRLYEQDRWQFAFALRRAPEGAKPSFLLPTREITVQHNHSDLTIEAIYSRIRAALADLSDPHLPVHDQLAGLSLQDRIYTEGLLSPDSPFLAGGLPVYRVPADVLAHLRDTPRGKVRHYLVARVASWSGLVETSSFIHLARRGTILYLEGRVCRQPAVAGRFRAIDTLPNVSAATTRMVLSSVVDLVRSAATAPVHLLSWVGHQIRATMVEAEERAAARDQVRYDYGARFGLRDIVAADDSLHFQTDDAAAAELVIQRRMMTAVAQILTEFGYDTSEFDGYAAVVIQNSTTISNSQISGSSFATGNSATSVSRSA